MSVSRIARTNLILGLLSLVLLPVSAFGTRLGLFPFRIGMLLFLASALLALVVIVIAALRTRAQPNEESRRLLSRSSLLALPAIASFSFTLFAGGDAPMIHNVTTAPDDPPAFVAAPEQRGPDANPLDYDAETAELQKAAYPGLTTLISSLPPQAAFERALSTSAQLGWDIYYQDKASGHIEAVATTRWFGFKDDIVIRIRPDEKGSAIDLRSVSRVGKGDLGANAKRIRQFLTAFSE